MTGLGHEVARRERHRDERVVVALEQDTSRGRDGVHREIEVPPAVAADKHRVRVSSERGSELLYYAIAPHLDRSRGPERGAHLQPALSGPGQHEGAG